MSPILPAEPASEAAAHSFPESSDEPTGKLIPLRPWGKSSVQLDFGGLLDSLGYTPDERVGVMHKCGDEGTPTTAVRQLCDALDYTTELPDDRDVYFNVNPTRLTVRDNSGRGRAEDVTRLAALYADIDVKKGACPDIAAAEAIVRDVSREIGANPSAITYSGNGLHVYWAISDGAGIDASEATELLRRFGRLVSHVGQRHGARVDSVFDLARMLRVPDSYNCKRADGPGILVRTIAVGGQPIAVADIRERLDAIGFIPVHGDRKTSASKIVSGSETWEFANETCSYVRKVVDGLADDGPAIQGDGRHPWMVKQAVRLTCAHRTRCVSEEDWIAAQDRMTQRLNELRAATGEAVQPYEVANAIEWAKGEVARKTDAEVNAELGDHKHSKPVDEEAFWSSCDELRSLRQFARARRVGPWAMFGAVSAIVIAAVPPHVVLPPLVGSYATLNTFIALVGASGSIKSAAIRAAYDWIRLDPEPNVHKPGSGEGLAKCFAYKGKVDGDLQQIGKAWSVVAEIPEVDALTATGSRGGSTLMSELRSAWSGERLGFDYAGVDKAITLAPHRYRLTMIVGVQPGRSGPLFADSDGGTPQRFVWLPTTDPTAPKERPPEPPQIVLDLPGRFDPQSTETTLQVDRDMLRRSELATPPDRSTFRMLGVPDAVKRAVEERTLDALAGTQGDEALDGHKMLCREKLAAFIGILRGHDDAITEEDWDLAGVVMAVSDNTRNDAQKVLQADAVKRNVAEGKSSGIRKMAEADTVADVQSRRIALLGEKVCAKLAAAEDDTLTGSDLKRQIPAVRKVLDAVLEHLEAEGKVTVEHVEYKSQPGIRVTLVSSGQSR